MEKGVEYIVPLGLKHIKIYDRTKKKRIKKKCLKKAPIIAIREEIIKHLCNEKDIKVYIGGEKIWTKKH